MLQKARNGQALSFAISFTLFSLEVITGNFLITGNILQIWENYIEGEEASNGPVVESKQKEVLKVVMFG